MTDPVARPLALVTGASGGMGAAITTRLERDGYRVVATDRQPAPQGLPAGVEYVAFDLLDSADLSPLREALGERPLDVLVNCAGIGLFGKGDGRLEEISEAVWERTLAVNLHAVRRIITATLPALRRGRGRSIVNVASVAGIRGMDAPLDAYQVSKAAVVSLSRSLGIQLGPEGIRCNAVCPGAILTPMIDFIYADAPERRTDMEQRTPLRRLGSPEDIAAAVAFLASPGAAFVTASELVVDGGWSAQTK